MILLHFIVLSHISSFGCDEIFFVFKPKTVTCTGDSMPCKDLESTDLDLYIQFPKKRTENRASFCKISKTIVHQPCSIQSYEGFGGQLYIEVQFQNRNGILQYMLGKKTYGLNKSISFDYDTSTYTITFDYSTDAKCDLDSVKNSKISITNPLSGAMLSELDPNDKNSKARFSCNADNGYVEDPSNPMCNDSTKCIMTCEYDDKLHTIQLTKGVYDKLQCIEKDCNEFVGLNPNQTNKYHAVSGKRVNSTMKCRCNRGFQYNASEATCRFNVAAKGSDWTDECDSLSCMHGDGGVCVTAHNDVESYHVFKPVSVQAMWSAFQCLNREHELAMEYPYFPGGLTHTWVQYYKSQHRSPEAYLTEWHRSNLDQDDIKADTLRSYMDMPAERKKTEKLIRETLKSIMQTVDLDEVTSRDIRTKLQAELQKNLLDYKEYIEREMLVILGQMDCPSQIMPGLYLGTEWNASNLDELRSNDVSHILNVTKEVDNFFPGLFRYMKIRVSDEESSELLNYWNETFDFITSATNSGRSVLVHCKKGISRSSSTVIAFIMKTYKWDLERALYTVQDKRNIIRPNAGFMKQLEIYNGMLRASQSEMWKSMSCPPSMVASVAGSKINLNFNFDQKQTDSAAEIEDAENDHFDPNYTPGCLLNNINADFVLGKAVIKAVSTDTHSTASVNMSEDRLLDESNCVESKQKLILPPHFNYDHPLSLESDLSELITESKPELCGSEADLVGLCSRPNVRPMQRVLERSGDYTLKEAKEILHKTKTNYSDTSSLGSSCSDELDYRYKERRNSFGGDSTGSDSAVYDVNDSSPPRFMTSALKVDKKTHGKDSDSQNVGGAGEVVPEKVPTGQVKRMTQQLTQRTSLLASSDVIDDVRKRSSSSDGSVGITGRSRSRKVVLEIQDEVSELPPTALVRSNPVPVKPGVSSRIKNGFSSWLRRNASNSPVVSKNSNLVPSVPATKRIPGSALPRNNSDIVLPSHLRRECLTNDRNSGRVREEKAKFEAKNDRISDSSISPVGRPNFVRRNASDIQSKCSSPSKNQNRYSLDLKNQFHAQLSTRSLRQNTSSLTSCSDSISERSGVKSLVDVFESVTSLSSLDTPNTQKDAPLEGFDGRRLHVSKQFAFGSHDRDDGLQPPDSARSLPVDVPVIVEPSQDENVSENDSESLVFNIVPNFNNTMKRSHSMSEDQFFPDLIGLKNRFMSSENV